MTSDTPSPRSQPEPAPAGSTAAPAEPARAPEAQPSPPPLQVERTRAGSLWVALCLSVVLAVVVLVFIFQNLQDVQVTFFTASGQFPLALALLFAAVLGALAVLVPGSVRILQLRRMARRHRKEHDGA